MTRERAADLFGPALVITTLVAPLVIGLLCLMGY
jgi:hypothetical protein